jgi:glycosyltransferase involved in cell wall biosynthesis
LSEGGAGEGPLSVVMVSASFHPIVGGAEKQALELSAALAARGHRVQVATRRLPNLRAREDVRGIPVHRLWRTGPAGGLLDAASFMLSLAAFLWSRRAEYSVIHVHLAGSPALASCVMGRVLRKKVFVKLGGGAGIGELAASSRTAAGRLKLRALKVLKPRFLAVAKELAQEAEKYLGTGVSVHILPNGVDADRYKPAGGPAAKEALRAKLGWPAKGLTFLYVGRLSPEKRLAQFAEIWAQASRKARGSFFFALVGSGAEEPAIESSIRFTRSQDRVKILPPREDVELAYQAADVFVLPSASEGLSNALLEALACGLPALASRVGGTPEAVEDGRSGLLFAPLDEEELKLQLGKLLERPELAMVMSAAARERAVAKFSLKALAERLELLYRY